MLNFTNLETLINIGIGAITLLVSIATFKERFTRNRMKQELKIDLEILEKIKDNTELYDDKIILKIKDNLKSTYIRSSGIFMFLYGTCFFFGFGYWTYIIIVNAVDFNGWVILTSILSLSGFAIALEPTEYGKVKSDVVFFRISFFNKDNFRISVVIFMVSAVVLGALVFYSKNLFWGHIASAIGMTLGAISGLKCTKFQREPFIEKE